MLQNVKNALGITGDYQNDTLQEYIDEVKAFILDAGVPEINITPGVVARGVSDLWNYGAGNGTFSNYFMMRITQLSYPQSEESEG